MSQHHTIRLSSWARLVLLSLLLGVGVLTSLGLSSRTAHAQPAATSTVNSCTEAALDAAINNAASGDTITFGCSGTITLSQTLVINKNLTLDGSGQSVTLDGNNSLRVLYVNSGVTFTLNALTIAHGSAAGPHDGGGLFNNGTVSISNSTFANNSASAGGGLYSFRGTVSIGGSIVANNHGGNCIGGDSDQGNNLESTTDCGFTASSDLQNTDPKLDQSGLQNNGGPTQTIALLSSSPAIDHIPAAQCLATDQRGATRPDDSETTCDIGAYESAYVDNDLGLSGLPATITINATSPHGAVVTYTPPTAVDESGDSPAPTVSCTPASGATFAIGTTTVTCTASDSDDTNSPVSASFTVTVKGAAAQVNDLISLVNSMGLSKSLQTSLDNKLKDVLTALQAGQTTTACSELTDFIGFVQSHTGKGLTTSQATQLISVAKQVQAVLGC